MIAYPSTEWMDCNIPDQRPDTRGRRVLVWHRIRPYCRFFESVVGWWNGEEWLTYDGTSFGASRIYKPWFWKDIIGPNNEQP